jgi:hypothetical protein
MSAIPPHVGVLDPVRLYAEPVGFDGERAAASPPTKESLMPETTTYELWVDEGGTVLVRRWSDGSIEVSTRPDPGAIWGPPVQVFPERAA